MKMDNVRFARLKAACLANLSAIGFDVLALQEKHKYETKIINKSGHEMWGEMSWRGMGANCFH